MQQQYADDTQLYVATSGITHTSSLSNLEQCLLSLHVQFTENGLALNPDKSDAILFGTDKRAVSFPAFLAVDFAGTKVPLTDRIKLLGVILDKRLSKDHHVANLCKACFFHILALRHIRSAINDDIAKNHRQFSRQLSTGLCQFGFVWHIIDQHQAASAGSEWAGSRCCSTADTLTNHADTKGTALASYQTSHRL